MSQDIRLHRQAQPPQVRAVRLCRQRSSGTCQGREELAASSSSPRRHLPPSLERRQGLCLGRDGHQLSCCFSRCGGSNRGWPCLEEGLREESQRSSRGMSRAGDCLFSSCCGNTWGPPQDSGAADEAAGGCPGQTHRSGRVNRHLPPVPEVLPQLDARERRHDDNPEPR